MDRRLFVNAAAGRIPVSQGSNANAAITGLHVLKLLAYDPVLVNNRLVAGQPLNTGGFLVDFARSQPTGSLGLPGAPNVQLPSNLQNGLTIGANAVAGWTFVHAQNFPSGLSILTVRDPQGRLWVIPDGLDPFRDRGDLPEVGAIALRGYDPAYSQQYKDFERYYADVVSANNTSGLQPNLIGQSLAGAIVLGAALDHPTGGHTPIMAHAFSFVA